MKNVNLVILLLILVSIFLTSCTNSNSIANSIDKIETNTNENIASEENKMIKNKLISTFYENYTNANKNFVYSPYSLIDCFKILYPASEGKAKEEIEKILGLDKKRADKISKMDKEMIFEDGVGMKVANKAYINNNVVPMENINTNVLDADDIDIMTFDDNTYRKINQYVEENTNGKIKDLLDKNTIDKETSISILLNCLYFMNTWEHQETDVNWSDGKYYDAFRDSCSLLSVKEDGDIDILKLEYSNAKRVKQDKGLNITNLFIDSYDEGILDYSSINEKMHKYSMYVICDNVNSKEEKVDAYIKNLTDKELLEKLNFDNYKGLQNYTDCDFVVPCFEMSYKNDDLTDLLNDMGMVEAFNPNTNDFKKFAKVYIQKIIQECYIKTNKSGTEAAAATAMNMVLGSALTIQEKIFKHVIADNTFAFFLVDDTTKEILFAGRINDLSSALIKGKK